MRDVAVIGSGMTKFGRRDDETLLGLLIDASLKAIDHAGVYGSKIDCVYLSSMLAGELTHQLLK